MEISTCFETYIIQNDEEFRCEITVEGSIIRDSFQTEFGNKPRKYIDNIFITNIYNIETDDLISFVSLKNKQRKLLLQLAEDYLVEYYAESYYEEE